MTDDDLNEDEQSSFETVSFSGKHNEQIVEKANVEILVSGKFNTIKVKGAGKYKVRFVGGSNNTVLIPEQAQIVDVETESGVRFSTIERYETEVRNPLIATYKSDAYSEVPLFGSAEIKYQESVSTDLCLNCGSVSDNYIKEVRKEVTRIFGIKVKDEIISSVMTCENCISDTELTEEERNQIFG